MTRIDISESKSHNPSWNENFLGNTKMPKRMSGESNDMYELRCKSRTDINMVAAKKNFDRPAYYLRFMNGGN